MACRVAPRALHGTSYNQQPGIRIDGRGDSLGVRQRDLLESGGGPAVWSAAAPLVWQGRQLILLEKAVHPLFHIRGRLLPASMSLQDKLGMRDELLAIGMPK